MGNNGSIVFGEKGKPIPSAICLSPFSETYAMCTSESKDIFYSETYMCYCKKGWYTVQVSWVSSSFTLLDLFSLHCWSLYTFVKGFSVYIQCILYIVTFSGNLNWVVCYCWVCCESRSELQLRVINIRAKDSQTRLSRHDLTARLVGRYLWRHCYSDIYCSRILCDSGQLCCW